MLRYPTEDKMVDTKASHAVRPAIGVEGRENDRAEESAISALVASTAKLNGVGDRWATTTIETDCRTCPAATRPPDDESSAQASPSGTPRRPWRRFVDSLRRSPAQ
jgi:hypothetical protein